MRATCRAMLAVICLSAATLAAGEAFAAKGGLSIDPGILEAPARPGAPARLKIANSAARAMKVNVAVHPWRQARSGAVTPDRSRVLAKVRLTRKSFRLPAGASKALGLSLRTRPPRGSLYGAIEVTGTPLPRGAEAIKVAYRLITSLRFYPPPSARRYRALPARLFEHGGAGHGALYLAVKNAGNTIDPIGGKVRIRGHGRTLGAEIEPKTILPGATVNLRLLRLRGALPAGRYRVGVRLTQAGRGVGGLRRGIRLR